MKLSSPLAGNFTWLGAKFSLLLVIPFLLGPASISKLSRVGAILRFHNTANGPVPATVGQSFYVGFSSGEIVFVNANGISKLFGTANSPEGMAVDSSGNLLVADSTAGVVYKFTPQGTRTIFASAFSSPS